MGERPYPVCGASQSFLAFAFAVFVVNTCSAKAEDLEGPFGCRMNEIVYRESLIVFRVIVEQNPVLNREAATEFVETVGSESYRQTEQLSAP